MLVSDLVTGALRLAGRLKPGQLPNNSESTCALYSLNEMVDSWAVERLMAYTIVFNQYPIGANQAFYPIGPGQASPGINGARPVRIEEANVVLGTSDLVSIPIKICNAQEWSEITEKTMTGTVPRKLYNDGAWPISNLYLWPVPSVAITLALWTWQPLGYDSTSGGLGFANLTDTISLAPGYQKAMRFNLAVAFAAEYGLDVRPDVLRNAADAKQKVLLVNSAIQLEAQQQGQLEQMNMNPRQDESQGQPTGIAA